MATLLMAPARAASQTPDTTRAATDSVDAGAPVVLSGDTLFFLHGRLGPFSAEARAAAVSGRLHDLVRAWRLAGDSVRVVDRESYTELVVGGDVLMTVLDADASVTGRARPDVAQEYAAVVQQAVLSTARVTSRDALLVDIAKTLAATLIFAAALWVLAWVFRRLYHRIDTLRGVRLPALRIQNFELLSAGRLAALMKKTAQVARVVLTLLLLYIFVPLVLSFFPWTAPLSRRIVGYALQPFAAAWLAFVAYLPNLFYLAAVVIITRYVLVFLHLFFDAVGSGSIRFSGFYPEWAAPTYKITRVLVFAFAAVVAYPFLPGASSDAFKGVSIFLGVLFSLGSSAAIGNMVAGVVLTYTRAFQVGDRVKIGDTVGDVIEKTLLVTRVQTIKNVAVTVPNGTVLSSQVVNYTTLAASHGLILHTSVTIGYDAPWRRVHELLTEAARRTEHILETPAPFVLQTGLDDFYVSYELNAYTGRADSMAAIYSALHANIQEAFNEGGVEIMSPHYGALRDGNATTIPPEQRPAGYTAPTFGVRIAEPGDHKPAD